MTEDSEEAILVSVKELKWVTCILYSIGFLGGVTQDSSALDLVLALCDSGSEVNTMHPVFPKTLGLVVQIINIGAKKIDGTTFKTYGMVVAVFLVTDQASRIRFFEENFLVANVSPDVVFGMLFLTLSGADVNFPKKELWWRSYTIEKVLSTTKRVELVRKKVFAAAILDPGYETFVVHIASLESLSSTQEGDVHPSYRAQIAALVANKASTWIPTEYSDFADVFSPELASELSENTGINNHAIKLVDDWQPSYRPIYSLGPVELETLKIYIMTKLKIGFIRPFKFPAKTPIYFDKKSDSSLWLYVNYWGLNNLTIKNQYPLPLVRESLDWLGQTQQFTQLNFTYAYHRIKICEGNE